MIKKHMMLIFSRDEMRNQSIWLEFPIRSHLLSPGSRDQCFGGERKEFGRGAHSCCWRTSLSTCSWLSPISLPVLLLFIADLGLLLQLVGSIGLIWLTFCSSGWPTSAVTWYVTWSTWRRSIWVMHWPGIRRIFRQGKKSCRQNSSCNLPMSK